MKIRFAQDKNINLLFEINIPEYRKVKNIKDYILEILEKKQCQKSLYNVDFICKNIILNEDNLIEFYRISPDDEIWTGRLEYFLTDDDVIVEMVLIDWVPHLMHVVTKKLDPIFRITSIIERVFGERGRIDLWNVHGGNRLEESAIIGEIDWKGGYKKIIISWGEEMGLTFEQCRYLHDRQLMEKYVWIYDWKKRSEVFSDSLDNFKRGKAHLDENFWQCLLADPSLDDTLLDLPESIHNLKFFCFLFVEKRISHIFEDHLGREYRKVKLKIIEPNSKDMGGFSSGFRAICVAFILEYIDNFQSNDSNKSFRDILRAASHWEFDKDQKGFLDYFLLLSRSDYLRADIIWKDGFTDICVYRQASIIARIRIRRNVQTILHAKQAISSVTNIPFNEIFTIRAGANEQPKDEDCLNEIHNEFEVICRFHGIETMKEIGRGGFATVYLSENDLKENKIALKKCDENPYREINILSQYHRYSSFSFFLGLYMDVDNTICIAMKYFSEGSLKLYLKDRNRLLEEEIARISRKLLQQIEEIHSRNIIHGDIKTDNVVFDKNHEPHLIDFGFSKQNQSEMLVRYSGNVDYQAPEIQLAKPYSAKMDIWSLGVMVIEMQTGQKPHIEVQFDEAVQARDSAIVQFEAENISDELKEFIDLSTKPDPNERATAKELLESQFIKKYQNEDDK